MALFLGGNPLTREDWAASPTDPFPDALKTSMPWEIVNKIVAAKTRWLTGPNGPTGRTPRSRCRRGTS